MAKFAVLFLILGLSAGLWLGFNPQAHAQTVRKWDSTKSAFLKIKADATVQVRDLNSRLTTSVQVSPKTSSKPQSQPSASSAWKQVSNAAESLWNSMQKIWANVTAKINTAR